MSVTLRCEAHDGQILEAQFLPESGMNLASYRKGNTQIIDQSTLSLFQERYAGLGALIGPHFHRRSPSILPLIKDENLFPHIARVHAKGVQDPFSHGIARYAPWKVLEESPQRLRAVLSGKDVWNGVSVAELEGQNFTMSYEAVLSSDGLHLQLSIVSDTDSLVGFHFYYALPQGRGTVEAQVKDVYLDQGHPKNIPADWPYQAESRKLTWDLSQPADYTFHPALQALEGNILLDAISYRLKLFYRSPSQENSWQLWRPEGASFVCVEPLSAQDPRHPNLTVSSLALQLQIEQVV